jgi:hypothetical protein
LGALFEGFDVYHFYGHFRSPMCVAGGLLQVVWGQWWCIAGPLFMKADACVAIAKAPSLVASEVVW